MVNIKDKISKISIDKLIQYANNPKKHPESQINKIASSIANYGFDQPIVIDKDNEIVKGHGRYLAAKKLGLEYVPVITREDLSKAQVKASRIADNKSSQSGWDEKLLAIELEELQGLEEIDIDTTGFTIPEIESITAFHSVVSRDTPSKETTNKANDGSDLDKPTSTTNNTGEVLTANKFDEEIRDFENQHGNPKEQHEEHWIWCETDPEHDWILKEIHDRYGEAGTTRKLDAFKLGVALGIIDDSYLEEV